MNTETEIDTETQPTEAKRSRSKRAVEAKDTDEPVILFNSGLAPLHVPYDVPRLKMPEPGEKMPENYNRETKTHTIWPGLNTPIRPALWKKLTANPTVQTWLKKRGRAAATLEVLAHPPNEIEGRELALVLQLSADVEAMEWWRTIEDRPEVLEALDEKIAEMKKRIVKDEDD